MVPPLTGAFVFLHSLLSLPIFLGMKTSAKITVAVLSTLLVVSIVLIFMIAHYTVVFVLDAEAVGRVFPKLQSSNDPSTGSPSPYREWMLLEAKQRTLLSQDGLLLSGYYIPAKSPTHRYVIISHGYKNSAHSMATYAHVYHNAGWNVLVPDHRAHGYSQGQYITMGWNEHQDLIGWVNQLVAQDKEAQILLHGLSMGASTVMMATGASNLPSNVVAAIEDCGYSSVPDELADKVSRGMGLPAFPLVPFTSLMARLHAGFFLGEVDCMEAVARSDTPTLFIHGEEDDFVPFWMLDEVYSVATCPKQQLVVPNAAHAQAQAIAPELYWSTVSSFVERFVPRG